MIDNITFESYFCSSVDYGSSASTSASRIYPNPASSEVTVEAPVISGNPATLDIMNIQGQLIQQQTLLHEKTNIDIRGLAKGVYILMLHSNDNTEVMQMVKE
ncbi:MAG: T9SS type A sorting domain-containing protein [Bacteroidota bacterium]